MATINLTITDLTFPAGLEDKFCKFRPLISIKYKNSEGQPAFAREALPGLGKRDFWECEKDNAKKDGYVRHDTEPKVDMDKLDISQREILFSDLDIKSLDRIDIELLDIEVKNLPEKIFQEVLKRLPETVAPFLPATMPITIIAIKTAFEKSTGQKVGDLEKSLLNKAIGKEDGAARSIWVKSMDLTTPPPETITLKGPGKQGNFSMTLKFEMT